MGGSWAGSMAAAVVATLGHPAWWAMALAAFLVRGGFLLILLPIVVAPSPAAIATAIAPTVDALAFGGLSPERVALGVALAFVAAIVVTGAGLAGSWLDLALIREAVADEDLDVRWSAGRTTARQALTLRVAAHTLTFLALLYGAVRLVGATYAELLSPGDASLPLTARVLARLPDVVALLLVTWLLGEAVGGLAARAADSGRAVRQALGHGVRRMFRPRGLATLVLTNAVLAAVAVPFVLGVGGAWSALATVLSDPSNPVLLAGGLLVFVSAWVLGLLVLAATLAWRAAAWTAETMPARATAALPDPASSTATEAATG